VKKNQMFYKCRNGDSCSRFGLKEEALPFTVLH